MLLKIIEPDSPQLGHILDFIRDESKVWTKYGLRSLSKDDVLYNARNTEHDPPYWRGQIWECVHHSILGYMQLETTVGKFEMKFERLKLDTFSANFPSSF